MEEIVTKYGEKLTEEECKALFDAIDEDGSGQLTIDEVVTYCRS